MDLMSLLIKITADNSEANDKIEETEKKAGGFKTALSKVGKVSAAAFAAVGTAAASATVAIGKEAVASFSNYEQLVGGVETLFKDSALKVQEYAKNAYATAGLSANDYMEQATSFSASLIQSLGNDTTKAADYADRAISDMSDNANKMGTGMEMIQNAYNGFAKGNFTMLDNLKLGYGGTKSEMERLIADASKMTDVQSELNLTVDEGDLSFGNIVNAISVMQNKMGIAGTTAEEAMFTIQGAFSATKAAWDNVITAIGGGGDISEALDGLMTSLFGDGSVDENGQGGGLINRIVPQIKKTLEGIGNLVAKAIPMLGEQIPPLVEAIIPPVIEAISSLMTAITDAIPQIIKVFTTNLPLIIDVIVQQLPNFIKAGSDIIFALINGLVMALPTIIQTLVESIPTLVDTISGLLITGVPKLLQSALLLFMTLIQAIPTIVDALAENLPQIIYTIVSVFTNNLPIVIEGAITLLMAIVDAMPTIISSLSEHLPEIIDAILGAFSDGLPAILDGATKLFFAIITALGDIILQLGTKLPEITAMVLNVLGQILSHIIEFGLNVLKNIIEHLGNVFSNIKEKWEAIKKYFTDLFKSLIESFIKAFSSIAKNMSEIWDSIKEKLTKVWDAIKESARKVWESIKDLMTKPIEKAKEIISGIVDTIKRMFSNLQLKFPEIKLPHFKLSPSGWKISDLLEGSIPHLSIEWYKKAYETAYEFGRPTVIPTADGLKGFGDGAGSEIVIGKNKLVETISYAQTKGMSLVEKKLDMLISVIKNYMPQIIDNMGQDFYLDSNVLIGHTISKIDSNLGRRSARYERGVLS